MIGNIMGSDGLIVLIVALVVLVGGSQLPKIARNVGLAGREFRKAQQEAEDDHAREAAAKAAQETVPPPAQLPNPGAAAPAQEELPGDASITLTPAQLDALLKAREEQVRGEGGTN